VDDLVQNVNLLMQLKEQKQYMQSNQLAKKQSKHTMKKMSTLMAKQESLEKKIKESGGWKTLLYMNSGKCDLNFDLKPWSLSDQVDILKEMKEFLERELEDEIYESAKEIRRLQDELEKHKKIIAEKDAKISELYQSLTEAEKKNLEASKEVVTLVSSGDKKEQQEVAKFISDFDKFMFEIKDLVHPEDHSAQSARDARNEILGEGSNRCESPEYEDRPTPNQQRSLTVESKFGLERRRALNPMQYTLNTKEVKLKGKDFMDKASSYSIYPKTISTASLRKASAQSRMKKPELPVVDIVRGKKELYNRQRTSLDQSADPVPVELSVMEMIANRKEQMDTVRDSLKGRILLWNSYSQNNVKDVLANKNMLESRLSSLNKEMLKHEVLAKKLRQDMEHQIIEDKQIEAEQIERYHLENMTFHKYGPDSVMNWARSRGKSLQAANTLYGEKRRPHANAELLHKNKEAFLQQAGYNQYIQRPGTAPSNRSPTPSPLRHSNPLV